MDRPNLLRTAPYFWIDGWMPFATAMFLEVVDELYVPDLYVPDLLWAMGSIAVGSVWHILSKVVPSKCRRLIPCPPLDSEIFSGRAFLGIAETSTPNALEQSELQSNWEK